MKTFASLLLSALFVLGACSDDVALEVQVVTSLVPGAQFTSVEIERLEPTALYEGARLLTFVRADARFGQDFAHGLRVASFGDVGKGEQLIQVRLRRADGSLLIARRVRTSIENSFVLRVHLTPDCVGVTCPAPAGSPALSECLAGTCVDERCSPPNAEFCPAVTFCNVDADCPAPVAACAVRACVEGVCQIADNGVTCLPTEYCDPAAGCSPQPLADAGIPDSGIGPDAGLDQGGADGGVAVPDGSVCGALCELVEDPCRVGALDCSTGVAECRPYATRPVGTPCGEAAFCDAFGECSACREGASCTSACRVGVVSCDFGYERCVVPEGATSTEAGSPCSNSHACVDGDTCVTTSVCLVDGTCGPCTSEGFGCELDQGCRIGTISCAAGGACVASASMREGAGCGGYTVTDGRGFYEGSCDASAHCIACVEGEACTSSNGCASGVRDCSYSCDGHSGGCAGGEEPIVGACMPREYEPPGSTCAEGVCDGNGKCFEPLIATHLGSNANYLSGCVVTAGGGVVCWSRPDASTIQVAALSGFSAVSAVSGGSDDGCALTLAGEIWCWDSTHVATLKALPAAATQISVGGGNRTACAIVTGGQLYCWGWGFLIGTGDGVDSDTPVAISGLSDIRQVDVGTTSSAVRISGEVLSWGRGNVAMIGDGSARGGVAQIDNYALAPVSIPGISDAVQVSRFNSTHACVRRAGGELVCWGQRLGSGAMPYGLPLAETPIDVAIGYTDILDVQPVGLALCTLRSTNEYWCFGEWNALARGSLGDFGAPGPIAYVDDIREVSGTCGLTGDGKVFCWEEGFAFSEAFNATAVIVPAP